MRIRATGSLTAMLGILVAVGCTAQPAQSESEQAVYSPDQLRSWRYYYPMDRGQVRGQRAGNPWASFDGQDSSIIAQLTWRLPTDPNDPAASNRPNATYPSFVQAQTPFYNTHAVEYYTNWWCQHTSPAVFNPAAHNCTDLYYQELISEVPDSFGNQAFFLGLWAAGITTSYSMYYDLATCDQMDSTNLTTAAKTAVLSDRTRRLPQLFALPATGRPAFFAPPACSVSFNSNATTRFEDHSGHSKGYIATAVLSEFSSAHGYVLQLVNYYYGETGKTTCLSLPGGSPVPVFDSSQGFSACVGYVEPYYSVNGGNSLVSGMTAWGIVSPTTHDPVNGVQWDSDHGWDAFANSIPPSQFSMDTCDYAPAPRQPGQDINCH